MYTKLQKNDKEALTNIEFNPKLKDLDIANCLLAAINVLLQRLFLSRKMSSTKSLTVGLKTLNLEPPQILTKGWQ